MLARCRGAFFLLLLPLITASAGCRNKTDLVEMELRTREQLYREVLSQQQSSEARMLALQLEIEALRKGSKISPEQAASTYGLKRIVLGRATGGFDNDGLPGDEVLQVVVEPRDYDDHAIKAPGTLQIIALEITPQGVKLPLCTWDISNEQLRQNWKQGLLSTGYTLMLPWKQFPAHEQVRVVVRFVTPDQRVYEADKDIKVRPVPGAGQKRIEEPIPCPVPDMGPLLVPIGRVAPAPHTTQWRAAEMPERVTIGRPTPID
ncbi:MAG: hypothetical protein HY289_05855 [Planctomycetes bacterium]|nr:hypothetical protein [Planctomycetota bacterium]